MKIIDIIEDKYEYAKAEYKMHKNTADCSYYMGYQDALGELIEQINNEILEEEKKIPEKLDEYVDVSGDLACEWSFAEKKLKDKINEIIDYLKSKGE